MAIMTKQTQLPRQAARGEGRLNSRQAIPGCKVDRRHENFISKNLTPCPDRS